jgi:hypothetical protein
MSELRVSTQESLPVIVPKSLVFYRIGLMELPAAPHGEQFDRSAHRPMLFQSDALWLRFKGTRKRKVIEARQAH